MTHDDPSSDRIEISFLKRNYSNHLAKDQKCFITDLLL